MREFICAFIITFNLWAVAFDAAPDFRAETIRPTYAGIAERMTDITGVMPEQDAVKADIPTRAKGSLLIPKKGLQCVATFLKELKTKTPAYTTLDWGDIIIDHKLLRYAVVKINRNVDKRSIDKYSQCVHYAKEIS